MLSSACTSARARSQNCLRRASSSLAPATLHIPPATSIFPYGAGASSRALFRDIGWTIKADERWAVVGSGQGRRQLIEVLQSHHRLSPPVPPPGRLPFLADHPSSDVSPIKHLLFAQPPPSGEFQNYTARYGALHEDDQHTLLHKLLFVADPGDPLTGGKRGEAEARAVARKVGVEHLLEVPFVGLSNGQTRRARMAMALLKSPKLLIVEEPFAGLDPEGREEVARILGGLQDEGVRVVLVLRGGEEVPDWVTHVAEATEGGGLRVGERGHEKAWWAERKARSEETKDVSADSSEAASLAGEEIVRLQSVNVAYGPKQVLNDITWSVKTGDRWHLQGHNGSGKTTLLALVLGEHPRSFSLPAESLQLFARPRRATPTPMLNALIGHTSPEIFKSFPRTTLTVAEAVGTGLQGVFSRRALSTEQRAKIDSLLATFWPDRSPANWSGQTFASLSPADQSLVLFCRALVNDPKLLILDEPFAFMEDDQIARCKLYLKKLGGRSAVVWVGHWVEERPWAEAEGKVLKLAAGEVVYKSENSIDS